MVQLFIKRKYTSLLISFIILLFWHMFIPVMPEWKWQSIFLIQNVVVGLFLFFEHKRLKFFMGLILIIILSFELSNNTSNWNSGRLIAYIVYFLILSYKVYTDIYKTKHVDTEMLSAVFCGFIMLGLIANFFFFILELNTPNSFSNIGVGIEKFHNLQYFGFVTILTIGYGDIIPLVFMAKKATVFMGLLGSFYTIFVMGIIIGKYIKE